MRAIKKLRRNRSFFVLLTGKAVFPKARGGRPPLAGRGSALRFRAGRGLCRRVVKAMTAGTVFPKAGRFRRLTAPTFYRSCVGALTDGFRPQSGLVQRELCMPPIGGYILIARRAIPQPFEPSEPFEPFEPSRRRRVQWRHLNPRPERPSNLRTLRPIGPVKL